MTRENKLHIIHNACLISSYSSISEMKLYKSWPPKCENTNVKLVQRTI